MQPIYLVCGVPGSGKTWVCSQLAASSKWEYVPHDEYPVEQYDRALLEMAKVSTRPILGEAPFRISLLIEQLVRAGLTVRPYFIIEPPATVRQRYEARQNKPIPKQHLTRIATVTQRARELGVDWGTSAEMLEVLKKVA